MELPRGYPASPAMPKGVNQEPNPPGKADVQSPLQRGPSSPGCVSRQTSSPDGATISWGYSGLCTKQQGDRSLSPARTPFRHHETGRRYLRPLCAPIRDDSKRHRAAALSSKLARSPWRGSGGSALIKLVPLESSPAPRTAPSPALPIWVTVFACSEEADTSTASQSVRNPARP